MSTPKTNDGEELPFPRKLGFLRKPSRYKVAYGGRGGAKSWGFARQLILCAHEERKRILCAREFQNSIEDSVHRLLSDQIGELGLADAFDIQKTTIAHKVTGSTFIFAGLRNNIQSIKSKEGIDIVWVEEAQTVSKQSWDILVPTIRKDGSEIWVSFNPEREEDPTYQLFVKNPPPNATVVKIGWRDNPWLPEVLRAEKDYAYSVDPESAAHVWGGETLAFSDAQVLRGRYVVESFEPQDDWAGPFQGIDFGFSVDPTVLVRCWVNGRKLYIEHEAYGVGVDLDDTPALFDKIPRAREYTSRADSSRPETISHLRRHGYSRVIPCVKRKGSVEDGVEHLRSYEKIVIHPRCVHAAEEARLWSYKTDRLTGEVLPALLEKHDHVFDAVRYSLELVIQRGRTIPAAPKAPPKRADYATPRRDNGEKWKVV